MENIKNKPITTMIIIVNILAYLLFGTIANIFGIKGGIVDITIFTSAFTHFSLIHLGSNMICLFGLGNKLEEKIGSFKFFILYNTAIIISGYFTAILSSPNTVTAGASGAVMAVAAMLMVYFNKNDMKEEVCSFIPFVLINLLNFSSDISIIGHLVGFITGLVLAALFIKKDMISVKTWKRQHPESNYADWH